MADGTATGAVSGRYSEYASPDPSWLQVAEKQQSIEPILDKLYALPIEEFRKTPYKPPALAANAPVIGKDITLEERQIPVRDGTLIGVRILRPVDSKPNSVLYFNVHGGGWTVGTAETEEGVNRELAAQAKVVTVAVDYRRAPEHPFPYALNDSKDALLWCKHNAQSLGINPEKIILGGGSAGANISAVLAHLARDEGITGIIGQVLNIPATCHPDHFPYSKHENTSYTQNAKAPIVNAVRMHMFWGYYLPSGDATPLASPLLFKNFKGLPPALVQVAGMDPLRDEGLAYAEELKAGGVDVVLIVYKGLPHAFYVHPDLPPSVKYTQSVVDWVKELLAKQ